MGETNKIKSFPDLVRKEGLALLVSTALLLACAAMFDAPLQAPADLSGIPSADVKAPWIFVGVQFLLKFSHPLVAGVMIPLTGLMVCALMPFLGLRATSRALLFFTVLVTSTFLTVLGYVR
ncbi:MAG: hypothetical protein QG577_289 [Thermodesulfobacteriota bacterium]|nr:hypothetical protein [Thermodesulfobacteriota bacterium]